jgi:hypothetical protein
MTTLALALLLSPALAAQPQAGPPAQPPAAELPDDASEYPPYAASMDRDPSGPGHIGPRRGSSDGSSYVTFYPADRTVPICLIDLDQVDLVHESEPTTPMPRHDALGRPVVVRAPRMRYADDGGSSWVVKGRVVVVGGMSSGRWAAAHGAACEGPVPGVGDWGRVLVERGLGSRAYATRQAATDVLVRMGERAMPALIQGLNHKDWEIRDRCHWALERIRIGDQEH